VRDSFISRKDRIISSAIEIISDSGLSALTTHNLALKENMSEGLLYKYFSSINEVLVEVVEFYSKFDNNIRQTIKVKEVSNVQKIKDYMDTYITYYDNYYALATLMLQYEELLHNVDTRDKISWCLSERISFIEMLFKMAIDEKEIIDTFTPEELANNVVGILMAHVLSRRIKYHKKSFKQEFVTNIDKLFDLLISQK